MRAGLILCLVIIVIGSVAAAPQPKRDQGEGLPRVNLKHVLDRFLALIDLEEFGDFLKLKLETDPEAQAVLLYLRSPDANVIVDHLWDDTEFVQIIRWGYLNGLTNVYNDLNLLHEFLGWELVSGPGLRLKDSRASEESLESLLEEIMDELPMNLLLTVAMELIQTEDPAVMALIQRLKEPAVAQTWRGVMSLPQTVSLLENLEKEGVDLHFLITILEGFFGWGKLNIYSIPLLDLELM